MYTTRRRSGGPRTAAGKHACSLNALKTGAYSTHAVLPWEQQQDYDALRAQLFADFPPGDAMEEHLLERVVFMLWKRLRVQNIESIALTSIMQRPIEPAESAFPYVREIPPRIEEAVAQLTEEDLERSQTVIDSCHTVYDTSFKDLDPDTLILEHADLCVGLESWVSNKAPGAVWTEWFIENPTEWLLALMQTRSLTEELLRVHAQYRANVTALEYYKEKRLLKFLESGVIERSHADADRGFSRALAEWRKHREWRLKHALIELEPANGPKALTVEAADRVGDP